MKLSDCEILHVHARNFPAAVVIGDRAISDAEASDLLREFVEVSGLKAVYFSRDGWQMLAAAAAKAPAEVPAAKKAKV